MKKIAFLSIIGLALVLSSCGGDEGPSITINSPSDGDVYESVDSITVSGVITDDVAVTSLSLEISKDGVAQLTGNFDLTNVADPTSVSFSEIIPADPIGQGAGDYVLTVMASDGDGNSEDESVDYSIQ